MYKLPIETEEYIKSQTNPFYETIMFSSSCPYRVVRKNLEMADFAPAHFAKTMEILLINGKPGTVSVGGIQYEAKKKDVFVIPPDIVHFTVFPGGPGDVYVFKLSIEMLSDYLDLHKMFAATGHSLAQIPYRLSEYYDEIYNLIFYQMPVDTDDPFVMVDASLRLLRFLRDRIEKVKTTEQSKGNNEKIRCIMEWTKEHMLEHITVEDAAAQLHYSKYHFCRFFKENAGVTYLKYLNVLRINHAIELLREGYSTTDCCYECGFENVSYFIRLFKDVTGYTTVEYRKRIERPTPVSNNEQ